ncbi:MAG: transcription factor S [Nitrososphaerota archaeon]|nr:transcription factor S [Candidatus Bathyarchaeota archaeon]MCX8161471.1 transcription factor S [Candidatus Bathyarchaeota archaeon]MDW8061702.1 transcription factor S [Nitrososphaerota archaeon]
MRFCPRCGARVILKKKDNLLVLECHRCGYNAVVDEGIREVSEVATRTEVVTVLGERSEEIRALPTTTAECPKCSYDKAYWWMVQTRSADEAPTRFFRCVKCGYVWREYA